jgi:hypothetical protein
MTRAPTTKTLCWLGWTVVALLLAGCSSQPPSVAVPAGFNLTGEWVLLPDESDAGPTGLNLRARGGMLRLIAQDFPVLRATRLSIEQGGDSMGISYDGTNYRDVSWGARKRGFWEVQTGWVEAQLVIISKAEDADARETFTLAPDGQRMSVRIELEAGSESLAISRTFKRL